MKNLTDIELSYSVEIIKGLETAIKEIDPIDWKLALSMYGDQFDDCVWVLSNLDDVEYGKARNWYYNTFEDNNDILAEWLDIYFDENWAKIAKNMEW